MEVGCHTLPQHSDCGYGWVFPPQTSSSTVKLSDSDNNIIQTFKSFFYVCALSCFSHVQLFTTLWTVAHQAPLHGILQARILEWAAEPSSRGSSQPRNQTHISQVSCLARQVLYC